MIKMTREQMRKEMNERIPKVDFGKSFGRLNNHTMKHPYAKKPCYKLGYCPYGSLMCVFPSSEDESLNCTTFTNDCPIFYLGYTAPEERVSRDLIGKGDLKRKFKYK